MIEMLVVIVIFLVGILALVQIFPGGFNVLRTTRNNTMAANMIRAEMERIKARSDQLPESIVAVSYVWNGTGFTVVADPDRRTGDISPRAVGLTNAGVLVDAASHNVGYWPYFSGANSVRRIVGEGTVVPAARFVNFPQNAASLRGGLLTLQFAPILQDPNYQSLFQVYGNNLSINFVDDLSIPFPVRNDSSCFMDFEGTGLALPEGRLSNFPGRPTVRNYRIACTVWVNDGANTFSKDILGAIVTVPDVAAPTPRFYYQVQLATDPQFVSPGETFVGIELDSVRVQRLFDDVSVNGFTPYSEIAAQPDRIGEAVYEYITLNQTLGQLLFTPLASNYTERYRGGRRPLRARVDYTVYDWRILRDDMRLPSTMPYEAKLMIPSVMRKNTRMPDQQLYPGMGFNLPDGNGAMVMPDFVVLDTENGAVIKSNSYEVDGGRGLITFRDLDNDPTNGLSLDVIPVLTNTTVRIDQMQDRSVRALYQGINEWSVQVLKPSQSYVFDNSASLGIGECYVGGSNTLINGDSNVRIYFPACDIGKKIVVGESWYSDGANLLVLRDQEYLVHAPTGGVAPFNNLGYIDITEKDATATTFDFSRGYSVRRVKGASVIVRAMWNPMAFQLGGTPADNFTRYQTWEQNWRVSTTQNFLMVGQE